jgi:hypothetical protein
MRGNGMFFNDEICKVILERFDWRRGFVVAPSPLCENEPSAFVEGATVGMPGDSWGCQRFYEQPCMRHQL